MLVGSNLVILALGLFTYVYYFIATKQTFHFTSDKSLIIIAFVLLLFYEAILGAPGYALNFVPGILLCFMDNSIKKRLLEFVTKWYSILIAISLIVYFLTGLFNLPSLGVFQYLDYAPAENYFFFIKSLHITEQYRFNGFFFEPGHCALVGYFILLGNRFQFKNNKGLYVILLSIILSFSLAGYLLTIVSFILLKLKTVPSFVAGVSIFLALYFGVTVFWEGGNNPVNELIVERMEYDERKGIAGNNRALFHTDSYFQNMIDDGELMFGVGLDRYNQLIGVNIGGAGYKLYLMQHGLMGAILVFILFYTFGFSGLKVNRRFALFFWAMILLCFLQRAYPSWFVIQLAYICSIAESPPSSRCQLRQDHSDEPIPNS